MIRSEREKTVNQNDLAAQDIEEDPEADIGMDAVNGHDRSPVKAVENGVAS